MKLTQDELFSIFKSEYLLRVYVYVFFFLHHYKFKKKSLFYEIKNYIYEFKKYSIINNQKNSQDKAKK